MESLAEPHIVSVMQQPQHVRGAVASWKYAVSPSAFAAELNSGCVVLNFDTGIYYALDGVGTRIWEMVRNGLSIEEMVSSLVENYDVTEPRASADLVELLSQLEREGLVCVEAC